MTILSEVHAQAPDAMPSVTAPLTIKPLDWDTEFFGARMGTVVHTDRRQVGSISADADALARAFEIILQAARAAGYAHLIFRATTEDFASIWAAERSGLRLVDVGIDSTAELARIPLPAGATDLSTREARAEDVPALRDLAAEAFTLSRFSADPFFSPAQVREFHATWITNLCSSPAHTVQVTERHGALVGFVSSAVTGNQARIPLIAAASRARGQGVGRAMLTDALRRFGRAGCTHVHVKTQARNVDALALYHRSGFNISTTELTFSISLGSAEPELEETR